MLFRRPPQRRIRSMQDCNRHYSELRLLLYHGQKLRTGQQAMKFFLYQVIFLLLIQATGTAKPSLNRFYNLDNVHSRELIKAVVRDKQGYLWIATDGGVLRYDGEETLSAANLPSPYVKEFLVRKNGDLLVIHDLGISKIKFRLDSIYFEEVLPREVADDLNLAYPKSIYEDRDSVIWIGEVDGIARINTDGTVKRYRLGDEFQSISYHRTFSFTEDAFGQLWVAPFKGPLLYLDKKKDEFVRLEFDYNLVEVSAIVCSRGDHLLVSGKQGLVLVKTDSRQAVLMTEFYPGPQNISDMQVVNDTDIFMASWDDGLYYWDFEEGIGSLVNLDEITIRDIVDLNYNYAERELWISGGESIGVLKKAQINPVKAIGQTRIESLSITKTQTYYSTGESVYGIHNSMSGEPERFLHSSDTYFSRLMAEENRLWVGDFFGAVYYYDINRGLQQPNHVIEDLGSAIKYISRDPAGNRWFAGGIHGLARVGLGLDVKIFEGIRSSVLVRASSSGTVVCAGMGRESLIYVLSETGSQRASLEFSFDAPPSLAVNDFQFDEKDNLWLATNFGLLKVKNEQGNYRQVDQIEVPGFSIDASIRAIALNGGLIWLAYKDGLVFFREGEALLFNKDSGLPSNILKERGLQLNEEGELLVHTAKGLAKVNQTEVEFSRSKTPVYKSFTVNGEAIDPWQDPAVFPYNSRMEVDFISLSFPNAGMVYQTRVLGYDDHWSQPSANAFLSILGFGEGDYSLEIRAKKGGYLWSEPLRYDFSVAQPWFRAWWAILSFLAMGVLILILAIQVHNRNLIRQKRKLQEVIEARTEEIKNQKNEIIEQQERLIRQKEELLQKNQMIHDSEQSRDKAELNFLHLKEKQLEDQIEYKNKQITTHALNILQKNETLKELRDEISAIIKNPDKHTVSELKKVLKQIDGSFKLDKDWEDFKLYFEQIYTGFYAKLKVNFPDITNHEMRHCALIRLNLPISECASILGISHDSVKVSRTRLRKKLGLSPNQNLAEFIMGL